MKIPCSVYIVTLNCGEWLQRTLESVADFDEVIILDSGSTDNTYDIAQQFENVKISHQDWLGYAKQKSLALELCRNKWVLNLDGDEVLSTELKNEIIDFIHLNPADALTIPFNDAFLGEPNHKYTKKHAKVRFFRKEKGRYDLTNQAHENVVITGTICRAHYDIYHYGENTIHFTVEKSNQYSTLKAQEKLNKGKKPNLIKLLLVMPVTFLKSYIIRRNFLNGWRGFVGSMINAFYAFSKEAKLFEYYLKKNQRLGK